MVQCFLGAGPWCHTELPSPDVVRSHSASLPVARGDDCHLRGPTPSFLSAFPTCSCQYTISVSSVLRVTSSSSVPSVTQESRFFPGKAGASCKRTRKAKSHLRSESATLCQSTLRWSYSPVRVPCQRLSCSHLCAQELTMSCPRLKLKVQSSPPATAPLPW